MTPGLLGVNLLRLRERLLLKSLLSKGEIQLNETFTRVRPALCGAWLQG